MTPKKEIVSFIPGALYTTDGKDLWRCSLYIAEPQVEMTPLADTGVVMSGGISKFNNFVRLVPEVPPPNRTKRKYERKQPWPELPNGEGIIKEKSDGNVS